MYRKIRNQLKAQKVRHLPGCPFCDVDDPQLNPNARNVVGETPTMSIIGNMFPYDYWEHSDVEDHLMIIPKRHVLTMADLTTQERKELMDLTCDYESRGYNIYTRAPKSNVRSVSHIHTHLIKLKTTGRRHKLFSLWLDKPYILFEK